MFRKLARPMIASVYIADGVDMVIHSHDHVEGTEAVIDRVRTILPNEYAQKVPRDPELVTKITGATKVVSGSLLALGKFQRLNACILAASAVPTIVARHAFWETQDRQEKADRRNGFLTDVALLGGLIFASVDTQGKPGMVWRTKHAAKVTNKKVSQALPGKTDTEKFRAAAGKKAAEAADHTRQGLTTAGAATAAVAAKAADKANEQAETLWDTYGDKAQDLVEQTTDIAADLWEDTSRNVSAFFDDAQKKTSEYIQAAQDYVSENRDDWLELAQSQGDAAKNNAAKAAEVAQKRADQAARSASQSAAKLQKKADTVTAKARQSVAKKFDM